jgi:hypothetical protein
VIAAKTTTADKTFNFIDPPTSTSSQHLCGCSAAVNLWTLHFLCYRGEASQMAYTSTMTRSGHFSTRDST